MFTHCKEYKRNVKSCNLLYLFIENVSERLEYRSK